jgi:hypothetical protein
LQVRASVNYLIYASVILGVVLLIQLYMIVPSWLFYSIVTGWIAYVIVAVLVARRLETAYPAALVLAILTLFVSLPRPEHQNMVLAGFSIGAFTFLAGSILQFGVIVLILTYYALKRKTNQTV